MDSTTATTTTSKWHSILPIGTTTTNRISPLLPPTTDYHPKRVSSSPSLVVKYEPSSSPAAITHLFKRLARTPSMSIKGGANYSSWLNLSLIKKKEQPIHVYLKSPHVVASGELAGTLVILNQHPIESVQVSFLGIEAVVMNSQQQYHADTIITQHEFLNLSIMNLTQNQVHSYLFEDSAYVIPFLITLPSQLSGTYIDKKGSIQYQLQIQISCVQAEEKKEEEPVCSKVTVYPNVTKSLHHPNMYMPTMINSKDISLTLPRTVWMSGAPIYITVHFVKGGGGVNKMKLELLRKQNTCCLHEDNNIMPLTSTCEVIATRCLDNLHVAAAKDFIMSIDAPVNQATVSNQKLIDVSFVIRVIAYYSKESTETILAEMPMMLVHPVAMDPPPSLTTSSIVSITEEIPAEAKIQDTVSEEIKFTHHVSNTSLLESSSITYTTSSLNCSTDPYSSFISSARHVSSAQPSSYTKKLPLEKMKRSFSTWGTKLSRKMSMTHISSSPVVIRQPPLPLRPDISSPILPHYSDGNSSDNEEEGEYNASQKSVMVSSSQQRRSVMKFGQMKGPKRFGQQPGSLGDAGLDIRNCFNVAKATEVIQSFAAEKVEIPDDASDDEEEEEEGKEGLQTPPQHYPPYLEPVQLEEQFIWKKGFIAPPEKCEIDISMLEEDTTNTTRKKYPPEGNKRMLASSRYLMQQQQQRKHNSASSLLLNPSCVV